MKRSNFTFLLFALLSFVSINLGAQSSSCVDKVNISVGEMCDWEITDAVLGATGPAMTAITGSGSLVFTTSQNASGLSAPSGGGNFAGGMLTGSLSGLPAAGGSPFYTIGGDGAVVKATDGSATGPRLPEGGLAGYQLWSEPDGKGQMVCWGDIQFEIKRFPETRTETWDFMCGQRSPSLPDLEDVEELANGDCSAEISNITEYNTVSGEACTGFETIRTITGTVDIDGIKTVVDLRIDTIIETPLDTGMVLCPWGQEKADGSIDFEAGPTMGGPVSLNCETLDAIGHDYASPDAIFWYYYRVFRLQGRSVHESESLAAPYAYPYLAKDSVTVNGSTSSTTVTERDSVIKVLVTGADGVEYWAAVPIVLKDTVVTTTPTVRKYPNNVRLEKGVTCNLSIKCTDMQFAGCAGPNTKIMRTWQILDWCNGSIKECVQWIKLEATDPIFTSVLGRDTRTSRVGGVRRIDRGGGFHWAYAQSTGINPALGELKRVVNVDIAPWTCAAQLSLSATAYWGCAGDGDIVWNSTAGTIVDTDGDGTGDLLTNLWLGENAEVCARAVSDCGSHAELTEFCFNVNVRNNIYPVPVAEDQVNVSLTGDPTGTVSPDGGVAKVFVDAIDAGSHNAGCGEVETCLLLKEELENPVLFSNGAQATVAYAGADEFGGSIPIYYATGCRADGVIKGRPASKLISAIPDIPYVVCKDFVKFCCGDQGDNVVALVATNSGGRSAHSWSVVTVEDKSNSAYYCRNDRLDCGDGYDVYDYYPASQQRVCSSEDLTPTVTSDGDACGNQTDIITWRNPDGEVVCQTRITIVGESEFDPYEIKWPKHYTGESEYGIIRECEPWLTLDSRGNAIPVTDDDGNELDRIVEYEGFVAMGAAFDCAEGEDTGVPVWCQAACALVVANFEPLELEAADACKKIIRRWTVIDWCTWDPNTSNTDDENDTAYDEFQAVDDEWLDAYSPDDAGAWYTDYTARYADGGPVNYDEFGRVNSGRYGNSEVTRLPCATCDKQNEQADHVYFRYTNVDEDGYYTYDQVIKVIDETAPEVTAPETYTVSISGGAQSKGDDFDDCYANETITASVSDMCGDTDLSADGAAWWITVYNADGDVINTKTAFGTTATMNTQNGTQGSAHTIKWVVRDGCGNEGEAYTAVSFVDDKLPTPVCIQDLSTAIMPSTGTVEIWAADYDNGSFDNCSEVEYWFLLDENGNPTDDQTTGTFAKNLLVTCDMLREFGQGETLVLGLYVSDAQLNIDFCNITLNVNGAAENCDLNSTAGFISGTVETNLGDMLESAEVALNVGAKDLTEVSGQYMFSGRALNQSYDIKAEKNDDYLNGVSTLDLVLIQKHVLGLQKLNDPYLVIASDINNDGIVTASDLVNLRKLILGVYAELPSNDSWRFVDAAHQFTSPELAFPFPEVVTIDNLSGNMPNQNFIGVKVGDVSGNAIANSLLSSGRSVAGKVALQLEDSRVAAGELVEVTLNSNDFAAIAAYQFTMELNGLEFVGATSGGVEVSDANFAVLDANTVTTAWFSPEGVTASDLFTLTFKATTDVTLSEGLSLSSRVTDAKAYTATSEIMDVVLEYNTAGVSGFVLGQNTPNPFDNVTTIGFELPAAGTATLSVFDVTGKTISVIENTYNAGYNTIELRKSTLGTTGVLYYQLESGDFTATKKMILID